MKTIRHEFTGSHGTPLAAALDLPDEPVLFAIFAHCFTCSKDFPASRNISRGLAERGIAVLRFDFTGLGHSDGDFSDTDFSSNVADIVAAAGYLSEIQSTPAILIGQSLGGAAALAAAPLMPSIKGVATIAAPSEPAHLEHLLAEHIGTIETHGKAEVIIGGRTFTIRKKLLDNLRSHSLLENVGAWKGSILVMHSPLDETVDVSHAGKIYAAARHPKSFVSLHPANHVLSNPTDADYAACVINTWARRICHLPLP
jgi:fermentation-respiration switch protein FrsA (DUF1100 family)